MSLSKRCKSILIQFVTSADPKSIETLTSHYKVSERTIRYDIKDIEYWLKQHQLGSISTVYGKGFLLSSSKSQKKILLDQLQEYKPMENYYSSEERQKILLLELLNSEEPIKSEYLQNKVKVSRGTILKELKFVEQWLDKYKLTLIKKPNYGIKIEGNESSKRNALIGLARDYMSTEQILGVIKSIESNTKRPNPSYNYLYRDMLMSTVDLELLEKSLYQLQDLLGVQLGDNSFASLFTHLAIAIQRIQMGKNIFFPPEDLILLEKTDAFKTCEVFAQILNDTFNVTIPKPEIGYITLHILAAQLHKKSIADIKNASPSLTRANLLINATNLLLNDEQINFMEMAVDITNSIKTQLGIEFENEDQMLLDLCIHLKPAIHRCKYKMFLTNPLLDDIKKNYYRLFLIVKEALLLLHFKYPIEMDDHEISYITLHFAAEIEKGKVLFSKKLNVLLVCASGLGTAKMLHNRILTNFSDLNIIDSISYLDYFKQSSLSVDLVISTIPLKQSQHPCIVVNPLLKKEDIERIETFIFEHHAPTTHSPVKDTSLSIASKAETSLAQLLTPEHIRLDVSASSWQEALHLGADILLENGYITPEYTKQIIENIHKLGPYIVIAPGIAFSHASYKVGVKKLGMSLIRLQEAVEFGHEKNDPVKLIFTLAPSDKTSHYDALTTLMNILLDPRELNILFNSKNMDEILKIL